MANDRASAASSSARSSRIEFEHFPRGVLLFLARGVLLFLALALGRVAHMARAQDPIVPHGVRFWDGAAVLTGTAFALDRPLHAYAAAHQTRGFNRAADDVDPFGRAQYLVPSLVAAAAVPAAIRDWPLAQGALRIG